MSSSTDLGWCSTSGPPFVSGKKSPESIDVVLDIDPSGLTDQQADAAAELNHDRSIIKEHHQVILWIDKAHLDMLASIPPLECFAESRPSKRAGILKLDLRVHQ